MILLVDYMLVMILYSKYSIFIFDFLKENLFSFICQFYLPLYNTFNHSFKYILYFFLHKHMSVQIILKEGNVHSYNIRQNTVTYTFRIAHTPKGLWVCI